jgi:hypothetical protein
MSLESDLQVVELGIFESWSLERLLGSLVGPWPTRLLISVYMPLGNCKTIPARPAELRGGWWSPDHGAVLSQLDY